jgi:regulator of protease activity HflC (stomatin/prohibitin superfamily)
MGFLFMTIVVVLIVSASLWVMVNRKFGVISLGVGTVLAILLNSLTIISAGHIGVQSTFGEVNMVPIQEGIHLVNPISAIKNVDVRLATATLAAANAGTKDLQVVHTDIVVNYRLDPIRVPFILKEFGIDVDAKILGPSMNEAFKSVTGHYNSEELITKRDEVSASILEHVKEKVAPYSITINSVSLVNFAFSPEYQKAIESKVIATQAALKAEQDLRRVEIEAKSRIAQAKGEAEAISIQAQAIQSSGGAQYVQLQAIEKWNGALPTMMSGAVPFVNVK